MRKLRYIFLLAIVFFVACEKVAPTCTVERYEVNGSSISVAVKVNGSATGKIVLHLKQLDAGIEDQIVGKKESAGVYSAVFKNVYPNQSCQLDVTCNEGYVPTNIFPYRSAMLFEVAGAEYNHTAKELVLRGGLNSEVTDYIKFDTNKVSAVFYVSDNSGHSVVNCNKWGTLTEAFNQTTYVELSPDTEYSVIMVAQPEDYPRTGMSQIFTFKTPASFE